MKIILQVVITCLLIYLNDLYGVSWHIENCTITYDRQLCEGMTEEEERKIIETLNEEAK